MVSVKQKHKKFIIFLTISSIKYVAAKNGFIRSVAKYNVNLSNSLFSIQKSVPAAIYHRNTKEKLISIQYISNLFLAQHSEITFLFRKLFRFNRLKHFECCLDRLSRYLSFLIAIRSVPPSQSLLSPCCHSHGTIRPPNRRFF